MWAQRPTPSGERARPDSGDSRLARIRRSSSRSSRQPRNPVIGRAKLLAMFRDRRRLHEKLQLRPPPTPDVRADGSPTFAAAFRHPTHGRRCQCDAFGGKRLARPAHHLDAFEHGAERGPLQAVTASDDRQRQADTPGPMRRKCRIGQRAAERERADRQPDRLSGVGQHAVLRTRACRRSRSVRCLEGRTSLGRIGPNEVTSLRPVSAIMRGGLWRRRDHPGSAQHNAAVGRDRLAGQRSSFRPCQERHGRDDVLRNESPCERLPDKDRLELLLGDATRPWGAGETRGRPP